jgi:hypothetical protein
MGKIRPPRQIKAIDSHKEVWEIRWDTNDRHLRLYHGEPPPHPDHLVPLRFHPKRTDGTEAQVRAWQDAEIDVAIVRYEDWAENDWFI